ncbi:MAG: Lar family restriction alleviation protein [Oscillospiraceae bacterium]|nr:Lar family restriction alleviation protein [Oscillospiraceae bacterium]
MEIHEQFELQDCPYCGGAALLEEEGNWCWYVMCMDCGAQTAAFEFRSPAERLQAAAHAAHLWNIGKVMRGGMGD